MEVEPGAVGDPPEAEVAGRPRVTSVGRNVVLSTLGNLANQVVRAGQQIIWVPLFLVALGKTGYGEWLTLFGLAGYAAMSDLGVQVYWLNLLTGAYITGDKETYRRTFRGGILLLVAVFAAVFVASGLFVGLWGPARVLGLKSVSERTASTAFLLLVGSAVLGVAFAMVRGVFRTAGENPKVVYFELARRATTLVLVAGALVLHFGFVGLAAVYGTVAIAMLVWAAVATRRRFPDLLDFQLRSGDVGAAVGLARGGSIFMAGKTANLLLISGTLIAANWALGAAAVALVATARTLSNVVRQVAASVYLATLPEFSRLDAANETVAVERLLRRSAVVVLALSGLACIALVGLGPWLYNLWTQGRFPHAASLIYLFAASVVVDALRMPLHDFLLGCNRIGWVSVSNVIYATMSLATMWVLFPFLGVKAVPIATMICGIVLHLPIVAIGTGVLLGRRFTWKLLSRMALGVMVVSAGALPLIFGGFQAARISTTLLCTVGALTAFGVVTWTFVLDAADTRMLRQRFVKAIGWQRR